MQQIHQPHTPSRIMRFVLIVAFVLAAALPSLAVRAEGELVASLENLQGSIAVKRFDASDFTPVIAETLVGVGDVVRTSEASRGRITFFANGVETEIEPNSELRIDEFTGDAETYQISVTLLAGQTLQRITKALDAGSNYTINSTGFELAVRGTTFSTRVKGNQSAVIVSTGKVNIKGRDVAAGQPPDLSAADVLSGFGARAEPGTGLSEVVKASNFAELDAALDGCTALIKTDGDVVLNVRTGPGINFPRVASLENNTQQRIVGRTETTKWYRIPFAGWFAWVYAPALVADSGCLNFRSFADSYGPEDTTRYSGITVIPNTPTPTPLPTAEPTPGS
jgi:FecR protein